VLQDLLAVWFPKCCWGCGLPLSKKQQWLCVYCQAQLPKTYFEEDNNNSLKVMMRQHLPLESAYAPFYFTQNNPIQHLLHALKYQGKLKIGDWMAKQCFALLPQQHLLKQCDAVVPVPLHPKREKQRGYNQSTRFGKYWANLLGVPFLYNILFRKNETKTLVRMNRKQRWKEVEHAFDIETNVAYEHLLLVDDVITTGATLTACGNALLAQTAQKISILGMAYAQNILP
jgi:ComF family protein